jgi:hypothetical protein
MLDIIETLVVKHFTTYAEADMLTTPKKWSL